jgi:hypothetical protein
MSTEVAPAKGLTSRAWAITLVVITLGVVALIYVLLTGMAGAAGSYTRITAPGHGTLEAPESGTYYIYHEYDRYQGLDKVTPPEEVKTLQLTVIEGRTGQEIALEEAEEDVSYRIRRLQGTGLWHFFAPNPGTFEIVTAYPTDVPGPEVTLSVGQTFGNRIQTTLLGAAGVIVITGLALTGLLIYLRPDRI